VKSGLGFKVEHREVIEAGGILSLQEKSEAYEPNFSGKNESLSSQSTGFWNENSEFAGT
jgi:hypothetical protein